MLGDDVMTVRMAGIYSLQRLAGEYPKEYHIQIMQQFCSFITNPAGNHESNDLGSKRTVNSDQATRQDVRAVMYALGKRSGIGRTLEQAAEIRLDLRGAILVGCDLSDMDFSQALFGGADLAYADLTDTILTGADMSYWR